MIGLKEAIAPFEFLDHFCVELMNPLVLEVQDSSGYEFILVGSSIHFMTPTEESVTPLSILFDLDGTDKHGLMSIREMEDA